MYFGCRMESEREGRRTDVDGQAIKLGVHPWETYLTFEATSELSFYLISDSYSGLGVICKGDLVNFVLALAYHFCTALPASFTQPGPTF